QRPLVDLRFHGRAGSDQAECPRSGRHRLSRKRLRVLARTDLATRAWALRSAPARAVRDTALRGVLTTPAGRRLLAEAVAGPRPARS
ncbi:hypothetical protein AB0F96_05395, partial [Streptomyces sp. NPDC023998]|uniref:hypothetical protein n=1 Tax=Streptomyces sp. NPDC023998 TaxID=3154597 RepID=UPI0033C76C30